ncbi:MAG TPA: phosphodiester glycosidase family protein [Bacilli bacterium]|nr:phosphodiester glycosidase family protein [Bacilli bacterium]
MKKTIKKICFFIISLVILTLLFPGLKVFGETEITETLGARYYVEENVETNLLRSGIVHVKDKAMSSTDESGMSAGGSDSSGGTVIANQFYPQSVNVLTVPSQSGVKVVNWTLTNPLGWTLATVRELAKDFEKNNPGWKVVAAINGDFFDIKGIGALPYQTNGVTVSNGEVLRPITNNATIGFTNNGTENSLVAGKNFQVGQHQLDVFDNNGEIIASFAINSFNTEPDEGETNLYFTFPYLENGERKEQTQVVPPENSYTVISPIRGLAMSANKFYGKGKINVVGEERTLTLGQFAIVTKNAELKALLAQNVLIRIQQPVIGDYAECDNIIGGGVTLVLNGEGYNPTDFNRHPRTMVGRKADGTLVFATVDGRQVAKNMYGMLQEEMAALMLHYGCVEAYNLDGGGSTTMIIREGNNFRVVNSPSEDNERRDSNALLIVVPELTLNIAGITDHSLNLSMLTPQKEVVIDNVKVTVNNQTLLMEDNAVEFTNLAPSQSYEVTYTYDLTYQGLTRTMTGEPFTVRTGKTKPTVNKFTYELIDGEYIISWDYSDPDEIVTQAYIKIGTEIEFVREKTGSIAIPKNKVEGKTVNLIFKGDWDSDPSERFEFSYIAEEIKPVKKGCQLGASFYYLQTVLTVTAVLLIFKRRK